MPDKISCDVHGESTATYICHHLLGDAHGLGFNRNEPTDDNPFPDAWCDDCEVIRAAHDGWNEKSEKLTTIKLACAGCYNRVRIRNTRTATTLDDVANVRWKCGTCEKWHTGVPDFGYDTPDPWTDEDEEKHEKSRLRSILRKKPKTWRDEDYAVRNDEEFYVRGLIHLPIVGTDQHFRWGVWGSLSRDNFYKLHAMDDDPKRVELGPMFSWLSNWIPEYGEVENIKMQMHPQEPGMRPHFEIEHTDHPLAQEYHHGITPERVKEIMRGRLKDLG